MKLTQNNLQMVVVSNQTKLTLNLLSNSQNKLDRDEIFTEASDECCLKQNQTKLTKSNTKFLKSCHSHIDLLHK